MDGLIIPRADLERMNRERAELAKALEWIAERLERGGAAARSDAISQARAAIAAAQEGRPHG